MAFYSFFPAKDTTIYQYNPFLNTGLDSLIELTKQNSEAARILMQFDIDEINTTINKYNIAQPKFYLNLYSVQELEIPKEYTIAVYPLLQDWEMGLGKKDYSPILETPANWVFRTDDQYWGGIQSNYSGSFSDMLNYLNIRGNFDCEYNGQFNGQFNGIIRSGSQYTDQYDIVQTFKVDTSINTTLTGKIIGNISAILSGSITALINGDIDVTYYNISEGGYFSTSTGSFYTIDYDTTDIRIDVTDIISSWITGELDNNGLIVKLSGSFETDDSNPTIQYFSRDTHTIYPPKLEMGWDDSTFFISESGVYYTQSYINYSYTSYNRPLTDLSGFYAPFQIPILPNYAKYTYTESYEYTEVPIVESQIDYFRMYKSNFPIIGKYDGILTGDLIGSFTGSLSGSYNSINQLNVSCSYKTSQTQIFDSYYSGSIIGTIYSNLNGQLDSNIIGLFDQNLSGNFTGTIAYFSGTYDGIINGNPESGIGIITQSLVTASLDGLLSEATGTISTNYNGNYTGSYNGAFDGIFNGICSASLDGFYSGNIALPFDGYLNSIQDNLSCAFNNTIIHATMSGEFNGYVEGAMTDRITLYEYYITGSRTYSITESIELPPLKKEDIIIYIKNGLFKYKQDSVNKVRTIGRERYPKRTYFARNEYLDIKYLPTSSYYSILDAHNNLVIVPFDENYTKLSCDEYGNYFMLYTNGLQPERLYRMIFKVVRNNMEQIFDNNYIFKVIR